MGRIPASSNERITYTLDKLVRVEQDTGEWKRHALHAGAILFFANQNGSGIPLRDGATCVDEIEKQVKARNEEIEKIKDAKEGDLLKV